MAMFDNDTKDLHGKILFLKKKIDENGVWQMTMEEGAVELNSG